MQIGDTKYLQHYLAANGYRGGITSKQAQKNLLPSDKDSLLEMICKNGHVDLLKQLREGKVVQDTNTFATKSDGQNCLHLATGRNRKDMVKYLLKENPKLANMADK